MLIILHGEDNFRSRIRLSELIEAYKKKHNFSLEKLHASDINFREFKTKFEAQSLFDNSRLVVVEGLLENPQLLKQVGEYFTNKRRSREHVLVLYETNLVAQSKEYNKILSLASKKQEFKKPSQTEALTWFVQFFAKNNIKIDSGIIREVLIACQNDMWQTHNELTKLYTYKLGKQIAKKDLDILSTGTRDAYIFPTIDYIFDRNTDKAFLNILLHWRKGEHPQYLFTMIERQLRILAMVKEAVEQKGALGTPSTEKLGLHPFVVKKTLPLTSKFIWGNLKALYARVESLDIKSKNGEISPYLACELLSAAVVAS